MGSFWVSEKVASERRASEQRALSWLARETQNLDSLAKLKIKKRCSPLARAQDFLSFFRTLNAISAVNSPHAGEVPIKKYMRVGLPWLQQLSNSYDHYEKYTIWVVRGHLVT